MRFAIWTSMSWLLTLAGVMSALPASFVYGTDAVANTYPPVVQGYEDSPGGLAIDAAGNRYITGYFIGTCDFNPGVGSDVKVSVGGEDAFVTRFNADGSYGWTQTIGGADRDEGTAIALSSDGATVYATGHFWSSTVRIGGAGPTVANSGTSNVFVIALDAATGAAKTSFGRSSSGIQTFGGSSYDYGKGLAVSGTTVYVTGWFSSSTVQIGGAGPSVANGGEFDAFVVALDAATGAAKTSFGLSSSGIQKFGGSGTDVGFGVAVSGTTVYATGWFASSTVQIGGLGPTVASSVNGDAFVIALDAATGAAKTSFGLSSSGIQKFGGDNGDYGYGLAVSGTTVYATGAFQSSTLQIGGAGPTVANSGNYNAFVIALDAATGAAKTAFGLSGSGIQKFGGSDTDYGYGLAVSGTTVYATGFFASSTVRIGGAGPSVANSSWYDAFVIALDAATGAAKTSFGLSSSGIQKFGGSDYDCGYGLATFGSTVYVHGQFSSIDAQVGNSGPAYDSTGFGGFLLGLNATTGQQSPTRLAITAVNGGMNPAPGVPFAVSVESRNPQNVASAVTLDTAIHLTLRTGTGSLGGTLTGTIAAGTSSGTISGVTYTPAERGVVVTVSRTSGDTLAPGDSAPFTVISDQVATRYPPVVQGQVNEGGPSVAIDAAGNRYITGYFSGACDFNPLVGTDGKFSTGGNDAFVTRFNADDSYSWTQTFGGAGDDHGTAIALSSDGVTVYATGYFGSSTVQIGGAGPSVANTGGGATYDAFVIALDAATGAARTSFGLAGSGIQTFGGYSNDYGYGLAVSATTVYATGCFYSAKVQIGGTGPTVDNSGFCNAFVIALDAATGAAQTSFGPAGSGIQTFGGSSYDHGYGVAVSGTTVYATGWFSSSPVQIGGAGPSVANTGVFDAFVIALDAGTGAARTSFGLSSSGIQKFGGSSTDVGYGLAVSGATVYATGYFGSDTVRIGGAGPSVANTGSGGSYDAFVIALDAATGAARTSFGLSSSGIQKFGGGSDDYGYGLAVSGSTVYATGYFGTSTVQIGGAGPTVATSGASDAFVVALDAATGAARTSFGLSSSGIQKFGGSLDDFGYGLATFGPAVYVHGQFSSTDAQVGGSGPAYDSTGFNGFLLGLNGTTGQQTPSHLVITRVNGGTNPVVGVPFAVSVESRNPQDAASVVTADTAISLTLKTGKGSLGGTLTGMIAAGTSSGTISGVTYTTAEGGVVVTVSRTSGDTLAPGDSAPFTVAGTLAKFALVLASPQMNGTAFTGANTLTAQDANGNTVTTFDASADNVTIVANAPLIGNVSGLGTGINNVLNRAADFVSGVADLTSLGMIYGGGLGTGTFTATSSTGATGVSGSVTINGTGPGQPGKEMQVVMWLTIPASVSLAWGGGTTGKTTGDVTPFDWTVQDTTGWQLGLSETCVSNDAHNKMAMNLENTSNTGTNARVFAAVANSGGWNISGAPATDTFAVKAQLGTNPQVALPPVAKQLTATATLAKGVDQPLVMTVMTPTDITRDAGVQKTIFVVLTATPE